MKKETREENLQSQPVEYLDVFMQEARIAFSDAFACPDVSMTDCYMAWVENGFLAGRAGMVPAARVEKLEAEIAELKQENIGLKNEVASLDATLENEITEGKEFNARTQKLLDALEWYADEKKYFKRVNPPLNLKKTTAVFHSKDPDNLPEDLVTTSYECSAGIKVDQGKRARKALAEYRGEIPESGKEE